MKEFAIFDLDLSSIIRRPLRLFSQEERNQVTFFYLNENFDKDKAISTGFKISKLKHISQMADFNLIIFGYRFPEMLFLNSNLIKGKIIYIQAGVNPTFLQRNWISILGKLPRLFQFITLAFRNFYYLDLKLLKSFFKIWLLNKNLLQGDLQEPNNIFLFEPNSESFYRSRLGWKSSMEAFPWYEPKQVRENKDASSLYSFEQYVCQSLVEDGRISKKELHKVLDKILKKIGNEKKLMLILHPNSKKKIYESHSRSYKFIYNDSNIIQRVKTHGHYSNLLIFLKSKGLDVRTWQIENHETPSNFIDLLASPDLSFLPYTNDILGENLIRFIEEKKITVL